MLRLSGAYRASPRRQRPIKSPIYGRDPRGGDFILESLNSTPGAAVSGALAVTRERPRSPLVQWTFSSMYSGGLTLSAPLRRREPNTGRERKRKRSLQGTEEAKYPGNIPPCRRRDSGTSSGGQKRTSRPQPWASASVQFIHGGHHSYTLSLSNSAPAPGYPRSGQPRTTASGVARASRTWTAAATPPSSTASWT